MGNWAAFLGETRKRDTLVLLTIEVWAQIILYNIYCHVVLILIPKDVQGQYSLVSMLGEL